MKTQYLNANTFLAHRENIQRMQQDKKGYLHTDVYLFRIIEDRKGLTQNTINYLLHLRSSTRECYQFEKFYWDNDCNVDIRINVHLDKQIGAMFYYGQTNSVVLNPIIYWINSEGLQCIATHLFGEIPVVLEFNNVWVRMFHNEEFEGRPLLDYVEAFNDADDIGMQESIRWAKNRLTIVTSSEITGDKEPFPLY
jgi:hypothetical protein